MIAFLASAKLPLTGSEQLGDGVHVMKTACRASHDGHWKQADKTILKTLVANRVQK